MPRRDAADDEDRMGRCPRCRGTQFVYDILTNTQVECPLCLGAGRVTRATARTFLRAGR